ncbi:hypothetical protein DWW31_05205 [Clostridium sp. AF15-17LB]|nr:hypothetical protein DWW31_05205 [Clostridium sp. AF15-17LB]
MCDYCEGNKPLTDKVYDDGSKFDDRLSTRIEFMGKVPVIISEYKTKNFNWPFCKLTEEQKTFLACKWAVVIKFCPVCGRKLTD